MDQVNSALDDMNTAIRISNNCIHQILQVFTTYVIHVSIFFYQHVAFFIDITETNRVSVFILSKFKEALVGELEEYMS